MHAHYIALGMQGVYNIHDVCAKAPQVLEVSLQGNEGLVRKHTSSESKQASSS